MTDKNCLVCDWNFDGICASHSMDDPDTYGMNIDETLKRFPSGCEEFRRPVCDPPENIK